jgi:hypothetical protein
VVRSYFRPAHSGPQGYPHVWPQISECWVSEHCKCVESIVWGWERERVCVYMWEGEGVCVCVELMI